MKKTAPLLLLCLLMAGSAQANSSTSQTFFTIIPQFHAAMPVKISHFYDRLTDRVEGIEGAMQIVPFGGQSINQSELAKYFMPFGKTSLVAGEYHSNAVIDNTVDLMANYFGVLTRPVNEVYTGAGGLETADLTFQSLVRLRPTQTTYGIGYTYRQKISDFGNDDKGWWLQASTALQGVSNDLGFKEDIINQGGGDVPEGFVGSIGDALRGNTVFGDKHFEYGKIYDCPKTVWGLADIELSFGYDSCSCGKFDQTWYGGLVIPTGNKPKSEYIFEPIVGNNHHWGLMMGGEYSYQLWVNQCCDKAIYLFVTGHSQYLFANTQTRSFDMIDKQWSRYIWLYDQTFPAGNILDISPGINFFTQKVRVSPRSSFNATTSFYFDTCGGFSAEAGYSTYYAQEEDVELACPFKAGPMIAGFDNTNTDIFVSESNANMRRFLFAQGINIDIDQESNSPTVIRVLESDLDLRSAAHPAIIAHTLYGSMGYTWRERCHPIFILGGGSYEWSSDNEGLHRWTAWGKFGISI